MSDTNIIETLRNENEEYKRLEEEHGRLEETLDEMTKKKYLNTDEEIRKKNIQKQKLLCKDRMAQLIREYSQ